MKNILAIVEEMFYIACWEDTPVQVELDVELFNMSTKEILENDNCVLDDEVQIEKEIIFESSEGNYCYVYTDNDNNINRLFIYV